MQFKDIIGQQQVKSGLISIFSAGKMPHALLFLGKEGLGGLPLALAFTQYVFCENKQDLDSCGICDACRKVSGLAHPDLHLSFPTVAPKPNTKASSDAYLDAFRDFVKQTPYESTFNWLQLINAENKQGNITAEECREMINRLHLTSFEGGYKIQIIWRPEYLGKEGNILLKLIEEPPAHTLIFLVAEAEAEILNTILSRTQKVMLQPLAPGDIAQALEQQYHLNNPKAMQIAHLSENSYATALRLLQYAGSDLMPGLREWFNAIFTGNALAISNWVDDMAKTGREQQKNFLLFTQQILAHALRLTIMPAYRPALAEEELGFVQKLAKQHFSPFIFGEMNDEIGKIIYHIERNAHSKTQLLYLSVQMQYLIKGTRLAIA
jgi:DNA polymerase-3 subunit delta'